MLTDLINYDVNFSTECCNISTFLWNINIPKIKKNNLIHLHTSLVHDWLFTGRQAYIAANLQTKGHSTLRHLWTHSVGDGKPPEKQLI